MGESAQRARGAFGAAARSLELARRYTRQVKRRGARALGLLVLVAGVVSACSVVTSIAVQGADFGGAFCQEVVGTLAASQFADDCRNNHQATTGPGLCPRPEIIAGCKLNENNSDNSQVWDWYYDVASFPDEEPDGAPYFAPPVASSVADVGTLCADPSRYPEGAALTFP